MEQHRIQRRLLELDVAILTSHDAGWRERRRRRPHRLRLHRSASSELRLRRARAGDGPAAADASAADLVERRDEWPAAGLRSVRAIGDASAPGTIAAAVWDGRRYAEELDEPATATTSRFRREVMALAPAGSAV